MNLTPSAANVVAAPVLGVIAFLSGRAALGTTAGAFPPSWYYAQAAFAIIVLFGMALGVHRAADRTDTPEAPA